jgi:hypothetical protein
MVRKEYVEAVRPEVDMGARFANDEASGGVTSSWLVSPIAGLQLEL